MSVGRIGGFPELPFSGTVPLTRHCSYEGAKAALPRAGSQAWKIYLALKDRSMTMHELEAAVDLPLATICARVGWLRQRGLVQVAGARKNPHTNVTNTIWEVTNAVSR